VGTLRNEKLKNFHRLKLIVDKEFWIPAWRCVQLFMARAKGKPKTEKFEDERIRECPVLVNGLPWGLQTLRIGTIDTIPSFDEYKCAKGHRTYYPSENEKLKSAENIDSAWMS
jgi:hypothetical protein